MLKFVETVKFNVSTMRLHPQLIRTIMKYFLTICLAFIVSNLQSQNCQYTWLKTTYDISQTIAYRIQVPPNYERIKVDENSFADWLRHLPLKSPDASVLQFDGQPKYNQEVHHVVIDIDTGDRDLQQCADAVMRLKAEYHYACGDYNAIHFDFTNGDQVDFSKWQAGYKPRVSGNHVKWIKSSTANGTYPSFRSYMDAIYMYAGTYSLSRELQSVENPNDIQAGDVFIYGGFPGHAVMVIDIAKHRTTGEKIFLLAQSYMPAQDIHILINPNDTQLSPWYRVPEGDFQTPEWWFEAGSLKRFK